MNALHVFFLAMLPLTELRASIPLAIASGMGPGEAFLWSVLGNGAAALLVMLLLPWGQRFMTRFAWFRHLWTKIASKTHNKGETVERYGALGLLLFVAVPLPGTGVWTGVLLAFLLGIRPRYAIWAVLVGMLSAGGLVTLASLGVISAAKAYGMEAAVFLLVLLLLLYGYYCYQKKKG